MATIGVHAIKGNVQDAINYIIRTDKTSPILCEAKNCNMHSAAIQWDLEKSKGRRRKTSSRDDVTGYHFRQSFLPGSISEEEAFEIAKEWIEKITQGNHDYVIATHRDTKHIHTHIIVNPRNNMTGKNINIFYKRDLSMFKQMSDEICKEHDLDILEPIQNAGSLSYYEWMMRNKGDNHKDIIRKAIDAVIPKVRDYAEFKAYLTKLGFTIEDGSEQNNNRQGLRIKVPNGTKFVRCKNIEDCSLDDVMKRIENNGIFVTTSEVKSFLGTDFNQKQLEAQRLSFYQESNIKTNFKDNTYYQMTGYEKMLFAKKNSIDKMLKEIHEMNLKITGLKNMETLKDKRTQLQNRIDEVVKQLRVNEAKLQDIMSQQMEGTLNISESELNAFIAERILPLREEKQNLKYEISKLSEIINKTDAAIERYND